MESFLGIGLVANLLLSAGLLFLWWQLRRRHQALEQEAAALAEAAKALPPELSSTLGEGKRRLVTIEILNPMEVASEQSWFVNQFGSLSPGLVNKVVHDQAAKIIGEQMPDYGIVADVKVHRAR